VASAFVRQDLVPGTSRADQDHRFRRLPAHAPVQLAGQYPAHDRECACCCGSLWSRSKFLLSMRSGAAAIATHVLPRMSDIRSALLAVRAGRNSASLSTDFYPEPERWRVNLTFMLAALLLLPLLIPRLPARASMPACSSSPSDRRVFPAARRRFERLRHSAGWSGFSPASRTASAMRAGR